MKDNAADPFLSDGPASRGAADAGPSSTAIIRFAIPASHDDAAGPIEGVHAAVMAASAQLLALLAKPPKHLPRAIVLAADDRGGLPSAVLASYVAGFGKSLARELARGGTTVNMIGGDLTDDALTSLIAFLLSDEARFVTGQCLGSVAAPLGSPVSASAQADPAGWLLVSGGAGAIGGAITRRLHADGWRVLIGHTGGSAAVALSEELDGTGTNCRAIPIDLTDAAALGSIGDIRQLVPDISGCVLCSGWNTTQPFAASLPADWDATLQINFTGPATIVRALFSGTGTPAVPATVVAIGSEAGRAGDAGRAVYAGAKAAIMRFCAETARDMPHLRAVSIAPGPVDTPLLRGTHGDDPATVAKGLERLTRLIPLGRMGLPEEIAAAAAFALSPAGTSLNGQVLSVGGGVTMQ